MYYVLYNTLSGNNQGEDFARALMGDAIPENAKMIEISSIKSYADFWANIDLENDTVVLSGGDGTLNRFVNDNKGLKLPKKLFYFASGSGNDFNHDVGEEGVDLIPLHKYIDNLPTVTVNGKSYYFVNGIGYGIDGYCCEEGDKIKAKGITAVNYTAIAIKGLLFFFKPTNAKITVDGVTKEYKKVWIAPTMKGRFYGGGMMVTPKQDRFDPEGKVSSAVLYGSSALKTLLVFPSIFEGKHVKHTEMVEIRTGHEVTVEFDRPTALQIDGETILGVTSYTVKSGKLASKKGTVTAGV